MRLLVVEDEKKLCDDIGAELRKSGYAVDCCYDGLKAMEICFVEKYDLIILDLNLPGMDGMDVLKKVREKDEEVKILILSARGQISDKVCGLDHGANDYLVKPFHLEELEARIRSLTRRKYIQVNTILKCNKLTFDLKRRVAEVHGVEIPLTRKETGILEYLMLHQDRPISQEELIEHVWTGSVNEFSSSIRVHISSLRKKLKGELKYDPIRNRIGEGYVLGEFKC